MAVGKRVAVYGALLALGTLALQKTISDAQALKTIYANPLYRLPMTLAEIFALGVPVSLVSAAVLRNPQVLPARG